MFVGLHNQAQGIQNKLNFSDALDLKRFEIDNLESELGRLTENTWELSGKVRGGI